MLELHKIATALVSPGKGILAADESIATMSGTGNEDRAGPAEVAHRTLQVLAATVPAAVPGIAFVSGGQSNERACANLAAINALAATDDRAPWRLTFSFGRALVADALDAWRGAADNGAGAQSELAGNCQRASAASKGSAAELPTSERQASHA